MATDLSTPLTIADAVPPAITGASSCPMFYWRPLRVSEYVPQRPRFTDEEAEVEFYARTAFTAWEHALFMERHHPKLWEAIKGSPYECLYRTRFCPPNDRR